MRTISPTTQKFIDCWGEMGVRWGVNRTVAQTHALFYLTADPLNAEDIAAALGVARSHVSTTLRELEGWGLIKPVHIRGDRRQHFVAIKDVWQMFKIILDERKRREIDPAIQAVRDCLQEAQSVDPAEPYSVERLEEALDFFEIIVPLYDQLRNFPRGPGQTLAKLKRSVQALVGGTMKR